MDKQKLFLIGSAGLGAGLGAGLMYLLDPQVGDRRRAVARDKAIHVLRDRVRSKIGRVVSHPHVLEVVVKEGRVILSGSVLASEVNRLLSTARKVKGVMDVESHLEIHEHAENVPALQGNGRSSRQGTRNKIGAALGAISLSLLAQNLSHRRGQARV